MNSLPTYPIRRAPASAPSDLLDDAFWTVAEPATVAHFHPQSSSHRPDVTARLMWDDTGLYGRFDVQDRYVLARHTAPQSMVCKDSCVELFFQPMPGSGYFNFELNAIGCPLAYYITDSTRQNGAFAAYRVLNADELKLIRVNTTLQTPTPSEITDPVAWSLAFQVMWPLVRREVPRFEPGTAGSRGNFFKCADDSSHPHWGAWASVGDALNFHQPARFGELRFE